MFLYQPHFIPKLMITVVNQFYDAEITKEYVMRGNAAILKCLIPSFVADFVQVTAWISDEGEEIIPGNDYTGGKMGFSDELWILFPSRFQLNFYLFNQENNFDLKFQQSSINSTMLRSLKNMLCVETQRLWNVRFHHLSLISFTWLRGWMKMATNMSAQKISLAVQK